MITLYQGDCLDQMGKIPDHTVDMIFTDLPYGTTKTYGMCRSLLTNYGGSTGAS